MSISAAEFEALQLQLIELKEGKYESQEREKKLHNEIKHLKDHVGALEGDLKKAQDSSKPFSLSGAMGKLTKDKKEMAALVAENEALTRNLQLADQEHREQQEATMQNVKNLYTANKALEEEVEAFKKTIVEKDRKIEMQEGQIRKIQVQLLQHETSADIYKNDNDDGQERARGREKDREERHEGENGANGEGEGEKEEKREDVSKLEEENSRLRENVRLLSSQLSALDEQLTKSEDSYRSQIASLEQQVNANREKLKQDEIASARMESRLSEELQKVLKDKEDLVMRLSSSEDQAKKDKSLLEEVNDLKDEVEDLKDKLSTLKISRDEYMDQVKKVTYECESVSQAKNTLETSLHELESEAELLRKVRDEHSGVLGELETAKNSIKNLQTELDRANSECSELEKVKKELEQVRQDLDAATSQANSLQAELDALKEEAEELRKESSKVEGLEQEVDNLKLAHLQAVTESTTHKDHFEREKIKFIDLEASLLDSSSRLAEANEQVASLTAQVTKLQTEKDDLITEHRIEDRKSQRMIKELKNELQKERTSLSRSASMDQFPSSPALPSTPQRDRHSPPMTPVPLTPPPHLLHPSHGSQSHPHTPLTPRISRQQAEAINSLPLVSSNLANLSLSPQTMEEILRRDLDTSLTMVGKLGEDKWKLEEKARFLEENLALVNEDLVRKTKVIQYYVNKTKLVVTNEQVEREGKEGKNNARRQSGVRGSLLRAGNDQELTAELLGKMEAVLEETVLRNVQLQTDMVTLGNETGQLQNEIKQLRDTNKQLVNENGHYKEQLVRVMSSQNV